MKLDTKHGQVELAEYHGDTSSFRSFALWFEDMFDCDLDYSNRDSFEDDFYWGLMESKRYSGIVHIGRIPELFEENFYHNSCLRMTKSALSNGREIFFAWIAEF